MRVTTIIVFSLAFLFAVTDGPMLARAQMGHVLDAVGPVNQSMAGAGTALPLDSIGALHWNPASITALPQSEIGFAFAAFAPSSELSSRVNAGAFGPAGPGVTLSGSTGSDIDINPMPAFGFVVVPKDSPWAYGLGGYAIAGFGVDYPSSPLPPAVAPNETNPILTPQQPLGLGFGSVSSNFQMLQIAPAVALRLTDRFSAGFSPTFNWTSLAVDPFPGASPNAFNTYPNGGHADSRWGLGFQCGVYWEDCESGLHLGLSYKSTQWLEEFKINSADEVGMPQQLQFDLDYPSILSLGAAYTGIDRWAFAWDVRYIDYEHTDGFREAAFDPTGAVTGFGWQSIWTTSLGVQYEICPHLYLRGGYAFNENAVEDAESFFNIESCAIIQHHLNVGFSWETPHDWTLAFAYHHGFENSISGPWYSPAGAIPGTQVGSELSTHTMSGAIYKKF